MIKNIIKKILKEELDLTKPVVVFVGGADGDGYKPLGYQTSRLSEGLGNNFTIISHRHTEVNAAIESIKKNPNCINKI